MARPTDCTPEVIEAFERSLRRGYSVMASAQAAGIHVSTAHEWRRRGEAGEQPFAEFAHRVHMAKQAGLRRVEATVVKAAKDDPKVALAILRARNPREWGGVQRHEHSGPDGGPVAVVALDPSRMTDEQIEAALKRLEER